MIDLIMAVTLLGAVIVVANWIDEDSDE